MSGKICSGVNGEGDNEEAEESRMIQRISAEKLGGQW